MAELVCGVWFAWLLAGVLKFLITRISRPALPGDIDLSGFYRKFEIRQEGKAYGAIDPSIQVGKFYEGKARYCRRYPYGHQWYT